MDHSIFYKQCYQIVDNSKSFRLIRNCLQQFRKFVYKTRYSIQNIYAGDKTGDTYPRINIRRVGKEADNSDCFLDWVALSPSGSALSLLLILTPTSAPNTRVTSSFTECILNQKWVYPFVLMSDVLRIIVYYGKIKYFVKFLPILYNQSYQEFLKFPIFFEVVRG